MSAHWAKVGTKCVCIDAYMQGQEDTPLIHGAIYTICGVLPTPPVGGGRYYASPAVVVLNEVRNDKHECGGFAVGRFRPLISKTIKDDMELFAPLLKVELVGAPV